MDDFLELYEAQLNLFSDVCADPWFAEQLVAVRAGDELALQRIGGSCLRQVLAIAKRKWRPDGQVPLLELVREGNTTLVQMIRQFRGDTAEEFLRELTARVEWRLTLLMEHPDLLG